MRLRAKLLIAPGIAIVLLLAFALAAFYGMQRQSDALDEIYKTRFSRFEATSRTAQQVSAAHLGVYRILSWGANQDESRTTKAIAQETERLRTAAAGLGRFAETLSTDTSEKVCVQVPSSICKPT